MDQRQMKGEHVARRFEPLWGDENVATSPTNKASIILSSSSSSSSLLLPLIIYYYHYLFIYFS
jgi:hypothetical protein